MKGMTLVNVSNFLSWDFKHSKEVEFCSLEPKGRSLKKDAKLLDIGATWVSTTVKTLSGIVREDVFASCE